MLMSDKSMQYRFGMSGVYWLLEVSAVRGHTALWWAISDGNSKLTVSTTLEVEPLVRAWYLGDCVPGIVADFLEECGDGVEWLLRLLRDDPEWKESLPPFGGNYRLYQQDVYRRSELADAMRDLIHPPMRMDQSLTQALNELRLDGPNVGHKQV